MKQITHTNLVGPSAEHSSINQTTHDNALAADSFASHAKGKTGLYRIIKATGYSMDGFKAAYKFEAAFRQVVWLNLVLLAAVIVMPFALGIK